MRKGLASETSVAELRPSANGAEMRAASGALHSTCHPAGMHSSSASAATGHATGHSTAGHATSTAGHAAARHAAAGHTATAAAMLGQRR
ncbi:hypothetical protein [Bradyrhizobium sp. ISRA464]|uniref:hypothetical protein n=1 Tax=Bradyrhizobium sp. ISRA464 TaxID=2866200 RepID=UPI0032B0268D